MVFGFTIFVFDDMARLGNYIQLMVKTADHFWVGNEFFYYLKSNGVLLGIALLLSMPVYPWLKGNLSKLKKPVARLVPKVSVMVYLLLFLLTIAYLVGDTYNPFLYFRF